MSFAKSSSPRETPPPNGSEEGRVMCGWNRPRSSITAAAPKRPYTIPTTRQEFNGLEYLQREQLRREHPDIYDFFA